jgi:hypothetical protein
MTAGNSGEGGVGKTRQGEKALEGATKGEQASKARTTPTAVVALVTCWVFRILSRSDLNRSGNRYLRMGGRMRFHATCDDGFWTA